MALAGMQEESLFLRSALWKHLTPDMYPIQADEALYAATVPLTDGGTGSFIACPGVKLPRLENDRLMRDDADSLRKKIELILQVAYKTNHSTVILGAMGCGVWDCPPRHVAEIFQQVLERYVGFYGTASFAILGANFNFFEHIRLKPNVMHHPSRTH